jgi:hypothetical protein
MMEVEKEDSLRNEVISDCVAFFCMSLNASLYDTMTVSVPIFQPEAYGLSSF